MSKSRRFGRVRRIHFTGIGGAGMSGIAEVLLNQGFTVTGSDLQLSEVTERLARLGCIISSGHAAQNVQGADVVVYSSAVRPENVEIRAAQELRIPTIPRSEMLAELMRPKLGIAIAGTHGKTTTTSMIGAIFQRADMNPTLIVGGIVRALQSGAKLGSGDILIVEADEFDRSFLKLSPTLAVITTIEPEHLDTYGDLAGIQDAFVEFANKVPFYGSVIVCADEPHVRTVLPRIKRPVVTYGIDGQWDFTARIVRQIGVRVYFQVTGLSGLQFDAELQVPGRHNVLNALAAIAIGLELDVPLRTIREALQEFTGVHRRFEIKGETRNVIVVDDYAHHPTEIRNTLQTARSCWPGRRLVALFQPHLYSRTRDFAREFAEALSLADCVLLADVYAAREQAIAGVSSSLILDHLKQNGFESGELLKGEMNAARVRPLLKSDDVLVVMGAGSITRVASELVS